MARAKGTTTGGMQLRRTVALAGACAVLAGACAAMPLLFGTDEGAGMQAVDEDAVSDLVSSVNYVSWASCVDPSYDGTTDYGFSTPTLTVTLEYVDNSSDDEEEDAADDGGANSGETAEGDGALASYVLLVGYQTEDGDYYAQPQGSNRVYTLSASDVEALAGATAASLAPDDVCLMDWDTVDSVDVTYAGQTKTVAFVRDTSEEGDAEGSEDTADEADADGSTASETVETSYAVDGQEADAGAVEDLLDAIDALQAEGEVEAVDTSTLDAAEITFTFHRSTETFSEMTLSLIPYDNSFYLVSFNGEERLLVNRNDVAELEELYGLL